MHSSVKPWLLLLMLWPIWTEAVTLKFATVAPEGTVWMREMRAAGDRVSERTEGRVRIKYYPGGVMGSSDTVMRKMRVGQLQGGAFTGGELAAVDADFYLYSLPFLFRDEAEVAHVRQTIDPLLADGLEDGGLVLLGLSGGGFVYLMSDHPVSTVEQLQQSKVWVPEGDEISEIALRLAGIAPVPIPLSDVYTALQTGVVDTVLNTPVGAIAFQWHTRMRHVADFPVAYVVGAMAVDKRSFDRLSPGDQAILREEVGSTFDHLEQINRQDNRDAREALVNQGLTFLEVPPNQLERWHKVGVDTIESLRKSDLDIQHLDQLVETLDAYRAGKH